MARIEDLPTELMQYVTDYLRRASDLAALARTSRRIFYVVDPVLYRVAKAKLTGRELWHPLRWGAEVGRAGTVKKALIAGIDANMRFEVKVDEATRDMQSFQIRVEAVDGDGIWDPPEWDPSEEWRPRDDDSDDDQPLGASRKHNDGNDPILLDNEDTDDTASTQDTYPLASAVNMGYFFGGYDQDPDQDQDQDRDEDSSEGSEISDDEDEDDDSSSGLEEYDDGFRGFKAIHLAARGGHDDVVRILLDHGAEINVFSDQLCTCGPGFARMHANSHGYPMGSPSLFGWSPLHLAICHFHTSTAKYLLSRGASVRLSQSDPDPYLAATALHTAAGTGQAELCRHLLEWYMSDVDVLDSSGLTPFYHAYYNGHWKTTVAFLLERGANIDQLVRKDQGFWTGAEGPKSLVTILYEACVFGRYQDAIKLAHLGANVNKGEYSDDVQIEWPLHAVCRPPREFKEPIRNPPLKLSAEADKSAQKRVELIETLLRRGANIEARSIMDGGTPLHLAARLMNGPALRAFLAAGANVEARK